jgi:hypothetical protein
MTKTANTRFFRNVDSFFRYIKFRYGFDQAMTIRNTGAIQFLDAESGCSSSRELWTTKWMNGPVMFDQDLADCYFKPRAL